MTDEQNPPAPAWLDDVISDHAGSDAGVFAWTFADVRKTVLAALQRYEAERPKPDPAPRRPWFDADSSRSDDADFLAWLANTGIDVDVTVAEQFTRIYQLMYELCEEREPK